MRLHTLHNAQSLAADSANAPLQRALHRKPWTETRFHRSDQLEPACGVKAFCVWIADDMQKFRPARATDVNAMVDECAADSTLPLVRLNKQCVEFRTPVIARDDGRKPHDRAVALRSEYRTTRNLIERKADGVWVLEQRLAVAGIAQRRAALELFKFCLLYNARFTNPHTFCSGHGRLTRRSAERLPKEEGTVPAWVVRVLTRDDVSLLEVEIRRSCPRRLVP